MKISIITTSLNSENFIEQTIQSVVDQDYSDIEYIVVDGGSSDMTLSIVRRYAEKDTRIRWISESDRGIADAMNKGIRMSTGQIIAHLHSDDLYPDPSILSTVAEKFAQNVDALWMTGGAYLVDRNGKKMRKINVRKYSYQKLIRGNSILHPATFLNSKAFDNVGTFDTSLKYAMDYDLWLRLGAISGPIRVDSPLACFRVHTGSLSMLRANDMCDEEFIIRKRFIDNRSLSYYYHCLNHMIKKRVNRYIVRNLFAAAQR